MSYFFHFVKLAKEDGQGCHRQTLEFIIWGLGGPREGRCPLCLWQEERGNSCCPAPALCLLILRHRAKELLFPAAWLCSSSDLPFSPPICLSNNSSLRFFYYYNIFFNCKTGKLKINLTRARTSFYFILTAVLGFVSLGANTLLDGIFLCSGL